MSLATIVFGIFIWSAVVTIGGWIVVEPLWKGRDRD